MCKYIWIYVHIHFQSIIFPNIQLYIHIHIYNVHIVQLYHIAYVVTITFCFKTSTLGRIHPALLMQTMIFFSNFKACLKEKRDFWRFSAGVFFPEVDGMFFPDILRVLVCFSRIFCWDDFQMSHMKIKEKHEDACTFG